MIKKIKLKKKYKTFKKKNCIIVGIGAAAKANTLLNTFGLTNKEVDFVTDNSKYKIGKFTTGISGSIDLNEDRKKL